MVIEKRKISNVEIKSLYFQFLSELVENKIYNQSYLIFLKWLNNCIFTPILPNDDNRGFDGIQLRDNFETRTNFDDLSILNGPCTILEMLIGLARRIDFTLSDDGPDQTAKWFWSLIRNLKLQIFWLGDPNLTKKRIANEIILKKFMDRTYLPNGVGGLFPLGEPKSDQRKVEIWYQLMAYIDELEL